MIAWLIDKLNHLEWRLFQWKLRLREPYGFYNIVQRRVVVEQVLFDVANKKRDLLTREECRKIALYLGDPARNKLEL